MTCSATPRTRWWSLALPLPRTVRPPSGPAFLPHAEVRVAASVFLNAGFPPAAPVNLVHFTRTSGEDSDVAAVLVDTDMRVYLQNHITRETARSEVALSPSRWHDLELQLAVSSTAGSMSLWVDGNLAVTMTDVDLQEFPIDGVMVGLVWMMEFDGTAELAVDDVAVYNSLR